MKKILIAFIIGIIFSQNIDAQEQITAKEINESITFLASDELAGRKPGTHGDSLAAFYIRDQFKNAGLELLYQDGLQEFKVTTGLHAGENNALVCREFAAIPGQDFRPVGFSANKSLKAEFVFAGYGLVFSNDSIQWDDYKNIDAKGKWVLILRGDPLPESNDSPFMPIASERDKVLAAKDHGALGVLFVDGVHTSKEDELKNLHFDKSISDAGIPVLQIKRFVADQILAANQNDIIGLEQQVLDNFAPNSFNGSSLVEGTAEIIRDEVPTFNVVAMLKGSDDSPERTIVVGAHYDHLGMGGYGSGSRMPDTNAVHNGADDNASGVAAVIEMAEQLASSGIKFPGNVIFMAFGAEEMGLLGSKYFVKNPPLPIDQIDAMINLDMIGRLNRDNMRISVGGTGTSVESETILKELIEASELDATFSSEGFGPSDHASFYGEDIPVFFISTGAHSDYHTPFDDVELIDNEGAEMVTDFVYGLLTTLVERDQALTFKEAGPAERKGGHGYNFKVTLGIMPDFTGSEGVGMPVGGVRPGGPAQKGGMQKGDRIIAIDGKKVGDIYEYMSRLKTLKADQIITVDVLRNDKKEVLIIQL